MICSQLVLFIWRRAGRSTGARVCAMHVKSGPPRDDRLFEARRPDQGFSAATNLEDVRSTFVARDPIRPTGNHPNPARAWPKRAPSSKLAGPVCGATSKNSGRARQSTSQFALSGLVVAGRATRDHDHCHFHCLGHCLGEKGHAHGKRPRPRQTSRSMTSRARMNNNDENDNDAAPGRDLCAN